MTNIYIPIIHKSEFPDIGYYEISNGIVKESTISMAGHFGNCITLDLGVKSSCGWSCSFLSMRNFTKHIGFICKALIEVIDKDCTDDNIDFAKLKGMPCRLVSDKTRVIGIGNYMEDRWLLEANVIDWIKKTEGYNN